MNLWVVVFLRFFGKAKYWNVKPHHIILFGLILSLACVRTIDSLAAQDCFIADLIKVDDSPGECGSYNLQFLVSTESAGVPPYEIQIPNFDTLFATGDTLIVGLSDHYYYGEAMITDAGGCSINIHTPGLVWGPYSEINPSVCSLANGSFHLIPYDNGIPLFINIVWEDLPGDTFPDFIQRDSLLPGIYSGKALSFFNPAECFVNFEVEVPLADSNLIEVVKRCEGTVNQVRLDVENINVQNTDIVFTWKHALSGDTLQSGPGTSFLVPDDSVTYDLFLSTESSPECNVSKRVGVVPFGPLEYELNVIGNSCLEEASIEFTSQDEEHRTNVWWYKDSIWIGAGFNTISNSKLELYGYGWWHANIRTPDTDCYNIWDSVFVADPISDCQKNLTGHVVLSESDCNFIVDTDSLANVTVVATSIDGQQQYLGLTDEHGYFEVLLPPGEYTLNAQLSNEIFEACNNLAIYSSSDGPDNIVLVHVPLLACARIEPKVNTPLLRRCFNQPVHVELCNTGTISGAAGEFDIILDDFLNLLGGTVEPLSIDGQVFTYQFPELEPFSCYELTLDVEVDCSATLGQLHCIEVNVEPEIFCPEPQSWDGATLEVFNECTDSGFVATIENVGNGDMLAPLTYVIIEDGVMLFDEDPVQMAEPIPAGESTDVPMPSQGPTYEIRVDQAAGAPGPSVLGLYMEGCSDDFSTGFANLFPNDEPYWIATVCEANIGSYDPNDKAARPIGFGQEHYVEPETELEYRIRFQNTGTDTAFTVIVRDMLSPTLDWTSFRMGQSSHDFRVQVDTNGLLTVFFEDIMLPDSFVNEPASNGFFNYQIRPRNDFDLPFEVYNEAAIYFDFNAPIITNEVMHTIDTGFLVVDLEEVLRPEFAALRIYPNPSNRSRVNVKVPTGVNLRGGYTLEAFDLYGRPVMRRFVAANASSVNLPEDLPNGVYLLRARNDLGQILGSGRLLLY